MHDNDVFSVLLDNKKKLASIQVKHVFSLEQVAH